MKQYRVYTVSVWVDGEFKKVEFPATHNEQAKQIYELWMKRNNYITEFEPVYSYELYLQAA